MTTETATHNPILAKKVRMPNYFDMSLHTEYSRAVANAMFAGGSFDRLGEAEAAIAACRDPLALAALCEETIRFHGGTGDVDVAVDVRKNNQLLGACRQIKLFSHGYEPEIHCAIDILTQKDAVIFDVGANWAPISLQAALRRDFRGRIFTFEPQPHAFANTKLFVEKLHLNERISPNNFGVSDREDKAHLSNARWTGNVCVEKDGDGETCDLMPLDALPLPAPNLIKIDVEGHETQVIAGARRIIEQAKPVIIFEDFLKGAKGVFAQLSDAGYRFYCLGWYSPFTDEVQEDFPFLTDIQVLALKPFDVSQRARLPKRINVVASIEPLDDFFPG